MMSSSVIRTPGLVHASSASTTVSSVCTASIRAWCSSNWSKSVSVSEFFIVVSLSWIAMLKVTGRRVEFPPGDALMADT